MFSRSTSSTSDDFAGPKKPRLMSRPYCLKARWGFFGRLKKVSTFCKNCKEPLRPRKGKGLFACMYPSVLKNMTGYVEWVFLSGNLNALEGAAFSPRHRMEFAHASCEDLQVIG
ncbi:hypothetical protein K443DRAFT_560109 [Laccaria amethystina LaAM-08-1]|uniref:Uncharacterized protein n=1 Tax=Laccaria amethystina LaAM-08-1 TaxID=1095629 RepID=A0A0C9YK97_9AGAR|nr:hypothetical protein K443DRAFT_560109 [Laccaria amethystina LaAM-08-1]